MLDEGATPLVTDQTNDGPQSLMEQLRAKRQEIAERKDILIPLAGYEAEGLYVKHLLLDRPRVEIIGEKVMRETKDRGERNQLILIDLIIASTAGFFIASRLTVDPEPLKHEETGELINQWDQLAIYLGGQPTTAREAVYWIFAGNEFAVGNHGIALNRWFTNTGLDVDLDLLGERA
jgi:hypothetical protein